jgi:lipoprotein-anchoring transpeptidase ErfK/SrfK
MRRTVLAALVAAAALATLGSSWSPARAENFDPEGRFTNGLWGSNGSYATRYSGGTSSIPKSSVSFDASYAPGTIVVNTAERRLYLVTGPGQAIRYGIGVGRDGFRWSGVTAVSAKKEWPSWTPPAEMRRRVRGLPATMKGGIDNPLGARAMYLGSSLYRIHGSNEPETIGQAVSSGCFRMTNDDVIDLYGRVRVGAKVVVLR